MKPETTLPIPGEAKDDFDKLKILFLRSNNLDLASHFEVHIGRRKGGGHGWTVALAAGVVTEEFSGPVVSTIVADLVASLSRKVLLRWRSDGGALQLAGVALEAFDREPEVVDLPDEIERRALPAQR